uniref:Histone H5 n=1 Tax=Myxobolus bejeranoi TaxID=2015852 RepID=A0AA50Q9B4_9CNID|nr:histone H5 [Myxobolus bejeranoi]
MENKLTKAPMLTKKASKPKVVPTHPSYNEMVLDAIKTLKERGGCSRQKIAKYIKEKYPKIGEIKEIQIKVVQALRRMLKSNAIVNTKGVGAGGSVKISQNAKDMEKKKEKAKVDKAKAALKEKKDKEKKKDKKKSSKKPAKKAEKTKSRPKPKIEKQDNKESNEKKVAKPAAKKTNSQSHTKSC